MLPGDTVEWFDPLFSRCDRIYASKVFTFTQPYPYFPNDCEVIKGETVLDFTAGSGTTGIAAMNTNRKAVLIEREQKYIDITIQRLRERESELSQYLF